MKDKTLLLLPVGAGRLSVPWPRAGTGVISLPSPRLPAQTSPQHTHTHLVSVVERNFTQPFPDWYCVRLPAPSSLYPKKSRANNGHERAFELLPWPSNLNGLMVAVNTALFSGLEWIKACWHDSGSLVRGSASNRLFCSVLFTMYKKELSLKTQLRIPVNAQHSL